MNTTPQELLAMTREKIYDAVEKALVLYESDFKYEATCITCETIVTDAIMAILPGEPGWQDISTAPKDGSLVDLSCISFDPGECPIRIRLTDCGWHDADEISPHTGWMRVTDDGNWDFVEMNPEGQLGLPPWSPTHWRHLPSPPLTSGSAI